jgi:hypothetical protein
MKHPNPTGNVDSIADTRYYLSFIDGLRGLAILMVLAVHTSQFVGNDGKGIFLIPWIVPYLNAGARGVQLFFLLSAFTLFSSSRARWGEERRCISVCRAATPSSSCSHCVNGMASVWALLFSGYMRSLNSSGF